MSLVVAETLLSADELKKDAKSEIFKGSPLLLQVLYFFFAHTYATFIYFFLPGAEFQRPGLGAGIFGAWSWALKLRPRNLFFLSFYSFDSIVPVFADLACGTA